MDSKKKNVSPVMEEAKRVREEIESSRQYIAKRKNEYENAKKQHTAKIEKLEARLSELNKIIDNSADGIILSKQAKIDFVNTTAFDITRQLLRTLDGVKLKNGSNLVYVGNEQFNAYVEDGVLKNFKPVL